MATLTSIVWGGVAYNINSAHLQFASWDPWVINCGGVQGVNGCCGVGCCEWYKYAWQLGVPNNQCVHPGVDIGTPYGTKLYAARGGIVDYYGSGRAYAPYSLWIRSESYNWMDIYGHLSGSNGMYAGKVVNRGDLVAWSGTAGSGPHVHFEVRNGNNTAFYDPVPVLTGSISSSPVAGGYKVNDLIYVSSGPVNLRSGAGTTFSIVASLATGTNLCVIGGPITSGGYTWWQVKLQTATTTGWVAGSFTTMRTAQGCSTATTPPPVATPSTFAINDLAAATTKLNLRTSASTSGSIIGSIPSGGSLCILSAPSSANGYTWYQVRYNGVTGYCINSLKLTTANGCAVAGNWPVGTIVKNNVGSVNLRSSASTSGTIIGSVPLGATATIQSTTQPVANGYTWINIKYGTLTGFSVKSSFIINN